MALGTFKDALKDFEYVCFIQNSSPKVIIVLFKVTKVWPNDKDARSKFTECNKIVKQIAFQKAISIEDNKKSIADTINLDAMSKSIFLRAF